MTITTLIRNILTFGIGFLFLSAPHANNDEVSQPFSSEKTWLLQLQGQHHFSHRPQVYEVDLFDTSATWIAQMKLQHIAVICYFSAGSFEDWRSDASKFHHEHIGKPLADWQGESWLDIRQMAVKKQMQERIKLAKEKGCDAVDPDNVDGFQNKTGFDLTADDQLSFNRFLADTAHASGLKIGLKNDLTQITQLEPFFDFAVNEQCHAYQECDWLKPFQKSNKLIINIEYDPKLIPSAQAKSKLCEDSRSRGMQTKVLTLALDGETLMSCF